MAGGKRNFSLALLVDLCYSYSSNFEEDFSMPRELAILACTECKRRNYTTTRNKRTQTCLPCQFFRCFEPHGAAPSAFTVDQGAYAR